MGQESVGALLKAQREQNQMDIDAVCRKTYIRRTYLEAIENGDYQAVGDMVYVKGFIRNYAQAVGLSGDEMVQRFNREMNVSAGAAVAEKEKTAAGKKKKKPSEIRVAGRGRRQSGRRPFTRIEWAILLAGAVLVALFWIWLLYL